MHTKLLLQYIIHTNLSRKHLSQKLKVSYWYLTRVLNGKRTLSNKLRDKIFAILEDEITENADKQWRTYRELKKVFYGMD